MDEAPIEEENLSIRNLPNGLSILRLGERFLAAYVGAADTELVNLHGAVFLRQQLRDALEIVGQVRQVRVRAFDLLD